MCKSGLAEASYRENSSPVAIFPTAAEAATPTGQMTAPVVAWTSPLPFLKSSFHSFRSWFILSSTILRTKNEYA
jgi:hypothetical protein